MTLARVRQRLAGVGEGAEVLSLEPLGDRSDEPCPMLRIPLEGLAGHRVRLLFGRRTVDHGERGRLVVDELADRSGAAGQPLPIELDTPGELFGWKADGERAAA